MSKPLTYGVLLSVFMVIAPHSGHLPLWVNGVCIGLLLWRAYITSGEKPLPKRWLLSMITLAGVLGVAGDFRTIFGRDAGVALLVLLAALKLMELRQPRDAMVVIYLACFIIITNFFYSQSIPTALYMLACLVAVVSAWIHLQTQSIGLKPRLRIASTLMLQAIPLTLILFVLFPRVQGPLWGLPQDAFATSGLDDKMSPGSVSRLSLSEAVAFRVTYNNKVPRRDQMYWRGPVLSDFDGQTWTRGGIAFITRPEITDLSEETEYAITLEPHNKHWLFALEMPDKLSIPSALTSDFQILRREPVTTRVRYDVRSHLGYRANLEEPERRLQLALAIPRTYNPRAQQLAAKWRAGSADDATVVRTALTHFNREAFEYTLEPPLLGVHSVDDFLFGSKRGFCEHYASAFVFLMRAANIPARVVTGYLGGEYNEVGNYYIVRQSDAHAWAEVWLKGQGWVRVDPTAAIAPERVESGLSAAISDAEALSFMARNPPQWMRNLRHNWDAVANQWNQWVLSYDTERQYAFLTRLGMESITWQKIALNMLAGVALVIALLALFMLRHLVTRQPDRVQGAWLKLCRRLAKAGFARAAHEGALDYAERVATARPELAGAVRDLAARYTALRYGESQDDEARREFVLRACALKP